MALFDLFNFMMEGNSLAYKLREAISFYAIPMVNPDGAERNSRYNAWGIDLNRDARLPQTPEAKLLKGTAEILQPQFAFNLHDQHRYYSAGYTDRPATISFLANPQDHACTITPNRRQSMQLIARMNDALQRVLPGHVGRYMASFDQTSFGDTFQHMGSCTLLVESGGYPGDPYRQTARKLNFLAILTALESIAEQRIDAYSHEGYYEIPENMDRMYDVMLRHVTVPWGKSQAMIDVGIKWEERYFGQVRYYEGKAVNYGDLSSYTAYEEYDCRGLTLHPGKAAAVPNDPERHWEYLAQGITHVQVPRLPDMPYVPGLLSLLPEHSTDNRFPLQREAGAHFIIRQGEEVKYAVLNGFVAQVPERRVLSPMAQGLAVQAG
jgi:hypothetical protein